MRSNVERDWNALPKARQKALKEWMKEQVYLLADKEHEGVQEVMIKLLCLYIKSKGGTDEECHAFIAWMRREYRQMARYKTEEEQQGWLQREIDKWVPDGFPQFRIDAMKITEEAEI